MLSTIVFVSTFLGILVASALLWVWLLRIGLRWAKATEVTTSRLVRTTAIVVIVQFALHFLFLSFSPSSTAQAIVLGLIALANVLVLPSVVISVVFKLRFWRAFQAWIPTTLGSVFAQLVFFPFVQRPFLYESFDLTSNAMAPTLVGVHWTGTCPDCGRTNYCSPRDERYGRAEPPLMICDAFHVTEAANFNRTTHSGDRILVVKYLTARRWDLVVFQYPEDPKEVYVGRLVGFPGEKVHIQDGSVWIDGKRQTPPEELSGIEYLSELPNGFASEMWGTEERPALLGEDEYFVLGDFSAQSMDSRLWRQGAPGHNSFAVPQSYIKGVVTHTFWPLSRWRIHR